MHLSNIISQKLTDVFSPTYLEVINESDNHNVPKGSESHFKVIIVSHFFENKMLLARHRAVNLALADEFKNTLHALAIHTYTSEEWHIKQDVRDSPNCLG